MFDIVIKIPQVHFKNSLPLKKTSNNIVTLLASCICRIFHCLCGFQTRLISVGGNQFLGGAADSARYQCFFHLSSEVCSVPVGQAGAGTWWSFAAQSPRAWRFAGSSRELERGGGQSCSSTWCTLYVMVFIVLKPWALKIRPAIAFIIIPQATAGITSCKRFYSMRLQIFTFVIRFIILYYPTCFHIIRGSSV